MIGMPVTTNILNLIRGFINQSDLWVIGMGFKKSIGINLTPTLGEVDMVGLYQILISKDQKSMLRKGGFELRILRIG
jgi:hypothetical protein